MRALPLVGLSSNLRPIQISEHVIKLRSNNNPPCQISQQPAKGVSSKDVRILLMIKIGFFASADLRQNHWHHFGLIVRLHLHTDPRCLETGKGIEPNSMINHSFVHVLSAYRKSFEGLLTQRVPVARCRTRAEHNS
jgi:hypothetical protein